MSRKKRWVALLCVFCVLFIGMLAGFHFVAEETINKYINQSVYTTPVPEEID